MLKAVFFVQFFQHELCLFGKLQISKYFKTNCELFNQLIYVKKNNFFLQILERYYFLG